VQSHFSFQNIPGFMFAGAILAALVRKRPAYFPERLMNWLLLLSVGVMNSGEEQIGEEAAEHRK
jgi:hypothetical protein